ncbi:hypothetical protein ACJ72_07188 [Emergomyces africanus]|uniref:Uncharacterized protein n=1 Tax=Emergomyces africanus TaxID=1955775 RepID=A0A1B7NNV4_9EURO|nr:hypothetical protein ACJ72_07188 [Emergomyces africanus]
MPSFTSEPHLLHQHLHHQAGPSPSPTHDHLARKSYDKSSISNAFVWTSDANGENGHVDDASDHFVTNFKGGSLPSLGSLGLARPGISESAKSRNGSTLSVASGPARDRERENDTVTPTPHDCFTNGFADHPVTELNGTAVAPQMNGLSSRPRSTSPGPLMNGHQTSSDDFASSEYTPLPLCTFDYATDLSRSVPPS